MLAYYLNEFLIWLIRVHSFALLIKNEYKFEFKYQINKLRYLAYFRKQLLYRMHKTTLLTPTKRVPLT